MFTTSLSCLPAEIVIEILEYLRGRKPTLSNCRLVSKTLCACSTPLLFKSCSLPNEKFGRFIETVFDATTSQHSTVCVFPESAFISFVCLLRQSTSNFGECIHHLKLDPDEQSGVLLVSPSFLRYLLSYLPNLKSVEVGLSVQSIPDNLLLPIPDPTVPTELDDIEFSGIPHRAEELYCFMKTISPDNPRITQSAAFLERLEINYSTLYTPLPFAFFLSAFRSIDVLHLHGTGSFEMSQEQERFYEITEDIQRLARAMVCKTRDDSEVNKSGRVQVKTLVFRDTQENFTENLLAAVDAKSLQVLVFEDKLKNPHDERKERANSILQTASHIEELVIDLRQAFYLSHSRFPKLLI